MAFHADFMPSHAFTADPVALGMTAHPEGGWYRETWRHRETVHTPRGERALATAVAFLLRPGECSAWHRVASDELWLWQGGGVVRLTLGDDSDRPTPAADGQPVDLGPGGQLLVPANVWQTAEPADGRAVLVACIVSPGFDFADFSLADPEEPAI
ncbi:MAG: cupin domain-containing protein [Actinomycetota bacterium]|nr:cupin domain-containing protein [Actinomycetota bacterium]